MAHLIIIIIHSNHLVQIQFLEYLYPLMQNFNLMIKFKIIHLILFMFFSLEVTESN